MQDNQMQTLHIWAYIAGLLDGEGSFMITRSTDKIGKGRKNPTYSPRVKCQMTENHGLNFIVDNTCYGKVVYEGTRPSRPNRKGIYKWEITSRKTVKEFLDLLIPFLTVKKKCAMHLREYCENFKPQIKCMDGVDSVELSIREDAYHKMRKLNNRKVAAETKPSSIREDEAIVRT